MLIQLAESVSDADCHQQFHPELASIGWYLARSVYLETYLIREVVQHDDSMTARVRHLFGHDVTADTDILAQLPPKEHLLNWAMELQEENLTRLANPDLLGEHPQLDVRWLSSYLLQSHARSYEQILMVLQARSIQQIGNDFMVTMELLPKLSEPASTHISQGHYRIGARQDEVVFDSEQPAQMVELSNYRIAVNPVSNADYLTFMRDDGYLNADYWSEAGWQWASASAQQPWHWKQNRNGLWFAIGLNGPGELVADQPVMGINQYEAEAFCHWLGKQHDSYHGAVLQHEYQWEIAARLGVLENTGRVREWTSSPFSPYPDYQKPAIEELACADFDDRHFTLRGVSLHSQPGIRRTSLRTPALPHQQHLLSGARLVFPPGKPFWEQ
jgi:iron(II)-dependent oxidoreductase